MDCCIYVITHKQIQDDFPKGYNILLVGADKNNTFENNYLLDNTGDNISNKNDAYCELTGLYWMWKNATSEYIGLVHYRRFFANIKGHFDYRGRHIVISKKNAYKILELSDFDSLLKKYDVLVKSSEYRKEGNEEIFRRQFGEELFDIIEETLNESYSDYLSEYRKVLLDHSHLNCNMFVSKKALIDEYCEWLFGFLEIVENKYFMRNNAHYSDREIGYIPELLFQVWLEHNKIDYGIVPVVCPEDNEKPTGVMNLWQFGLFFVKKTKERIFR